MPIIREPTFNAKLAEILRSKNPRWRTGNVVLAEAGRALDGGKTPDILINTVAAMPIVVESEFMPANTVEEGATSRLREVVRDTNKAIEQAIALRIPAVVRNVSPDKLSDCIGQSEFEYCLFSAYEDGHLPTRWPEKGWLKGGVDELTTLIENALISENVIASGLAILDGGITSAAAVLINGTLDKPDVSKNIAALLHQSDGKQTMRMAMAITLNALTFHYILAGSHEIKSIHELRHIAGGELLRADLLREWQSIVDDINYYPIFDIAQRIVELFPDSNDVATNIMEILEEVANKLVAKKITASHDLYGRMFQRLVTDRKYLATFYTMPESAILLAEIAVRKMGLQFTEHTAPSLRVADFACGTGTLLAAAYHAVLTRHRRAGYDDAKIHKKMMEDALIGTDIMPAGVHMTVAVLSNVHPTITFNGTKVHTLPYGTDKLFLGALDLLHSHSSHDLLSTRTQMGGDQTKELAGTMAKSDAFALEHKSCDLVIMNPPFTRPTNHKITDKPIPSFAGFATSDDEQRAMSKRAKEIFNKIPDHASNGYAGLGSNFIDIAHQKLKAGGIMALVIPFTFASGAGWARSRKLFDLYYDDVTVVSMAASGEKSTCFSADTGMAEVLVVAKKRAARRKAGHAKVKFVSLRKRPGNSAQAAAVAEIIDKSDSTMYAGGDYIGGIFDGNLMDGGVAGVFDLALIKTVTALQGSALKLPGNPNAYALPITKLGDIANRGLVHRLINHKSIKTGEPLGPFDIETLRGIPTYPCLWGHDYTIEKSFVVQPDSQGSVRKGMQKDADRVWATRSTLHFNLDFGLASQSISACITPMPTIGGRAWPNVLPIESTHEPAIMLWANSTLGLLMRWHSASRQQPGRAITTISRLPKLQVLDTRKLTTAQHKKAAKIFNRLKTKHFRPANEAWHDPVRIELDRALLVELLGLPETVMESMELLRRKWCFEPSVHGGKSTRLMEADS